MRSAEGVIDGLLGAWPSCIQTCLDLALEGPGDEAKVTDLCECYSSYIGIV